MRRALLLLALLLPAAKSIATCGDVIRLPAHDGATQQYALTLPDGKAGKTVATLVLLAGGGGHLALDAQGCPTALTGNSLVRMRTRFLAAGFATAYVDAPSDHTGEDGLGGFRVTQAHASDLGQVIRDLRERTGRAIWIVGTSRGSISAANAAARLEGSERPDGVVLTSPVSVGNPQGRKTWVAQTVFDVPLRQLRQPLLVVGHAEDTCLRSPASMVEKIATESSSKRRQAVVITGGPGASVAPGLAACEGRSPHGFLEQENELAAGIARFISGSRY